MILAGQDLALDEQGGAAVEGQIRGVGLGMWLVQWVQNAGEFEGVQLFTGILLEPGDSSPDRAQC